MKLLRLLVATCLADLVLSKLYVSPIVQYETIVWAPNVTFRDVTSYSNPIIGPTATGSIVAFSEAQTSSDNDRGKKFLAQSTSVDGGVSWTHQFDISDKFLSVDGVHLGEVLTDEETGTMFMVYSESAGTSGGEWKTYLINSTDGGKDWTTFADLSNISEPRQAAFHPGPGRGLQLKHEPYKGRLLFCGHANVTYDGVVCIYSDDHGYNWERGALLPGVPYGAEKIYRDFEPSQNQAVELSNGTILFTIRNERQYHSPSRIFARSYDGGKSINPRDVYIEENIPDPVCAAGMLYIDEYNLLLHSNPFCTTERINMTLSWSYDDGLSWNDSDHLLVLPGPCGYSCLTTIPGYPEYVGLLYEKGSTISYALINLIPVFGE